MYAVDIVTADLYYPLQVVIVMSYACTTCDAEFSSAASVSQHVALHHNTCAVCNDSFEDVDGLRDHTHSAH